MLQEFSPGYAGQAQQETYEGQKIDQTADQNELKLIKAQADMLATELAQEKRVWKNLTDIFVLNVMNVKRLR